ncbi:MAG TPA: carboxypeptidase-like regulatory domain-containing protein [Candidatus Thermoplasmatota archaeon]|nr:carboxypeptidase-like regulatory domain-containing protein [Candidatus Thermoplasmatota archaeon]
MDGWPGLLLVACLVLSGCSGSGGGNADAATDAAARLGELDAKVSGTTGAIKGVVVDGSITPVPSAKVVLALPAGGNKTATTDKEGRFVFSDLAPGTYFLTGSAPLYHSAQTSVEVKAGESTIAKVQIQPLFDKKPFHVPIKQKGFFECSQAGIGVYSSSNCVTDPCPSQFDPATCNGYPTHSLDNVTTQSREWHMDVGAGWQQMVFEMTWAPTAQGTSAWMGMVVSTYKPTRDTTHSFANVNSANPMRFQLDVGKEGPGAASVEPTTIPSEGMEKVSFFVSARRNYDSPTCVASCPPGLSLNQEFSVVITQFYYGLPPEGWSFVKGDPYPF